jgi:hypothetical protein
MYSGGDLDTAYALSVEDITITDDGSNKLRIPQRSEKDVRNVTQVLSGIMPSMFAFLPNINQGSILFDTIPPADCTISIRSLKPIDEFTSLTATTSFPQGYNPALIYNLAVRLAPKYGKTPRQDIVAVADKTYRDIKRQNSRNRRPAELRTDHLPGVQTTRANIDYLP